MLHINYTKYNSVINPKFYNLGITYLSINEKYF